MASERHCGRRWFDLLEAELVAVSGKGWMPSRPSRPSKTDFSLVTQLDGPAEPVQVIFFYDTKVVELRRPVFDWMRVFQPWMAQRRRRTKQLLWQRRKPHLGGEW